MRCNLCSALRQLLITFGPLPPAQPFKFAGLTAADFKGKNVLIFLTDQERATQNFPAGWEEKNMPGLTRLKKNGLTFENAFTNACMCSPSRSTMLSGYFTAQSGVRYTLENNMPAYEYPQVEMPVTLKNIAHVMSDAGYNVVYKGKLHVDKPSGDNFTWVTEDAGKYGFTRWNPPVSLIIYHHLCLAHRISHYFLTLYVHHPRLMNVG